MSLIDDLKKNEKAFGLMSEEMQAKAMEVGHCNFLKYMGPKYLGDTWYNGSITGFLKTTPTASAPTTKKSRRLWRMSSS